MQTAGDIIPITRMARGRWSSGMSRSGCMCFEEFQSANTYQEYSTSARGESIGGVVARLKDIDPVVTDEIRQTAPRRRDAE